MTAAKLTPEIAEKLIAGAKAGSYMEIGRASCRERV